MVYGPSHRSIVERDLGPLWFRAHGAVHGLRGVGQPLGPTGSTEQATGELNFGQATAGMIVGHNSFGPNANCVDLKNSSGYCQSFGRTPSLPNHNLGVSWRTKPRSHVIDFDSSSPCIRLTCIPNFHASDFSAAIKYGSNFDNNDSYVPMPVGTSSWYLDFGATHHVC